MFASRSKYVAVTFKKLYLNKCHTNFVSLSFIAHKNKGNDKYSNETFKRLCAIGLIGTSYLLYKRKVNAEAGKNVIYSLEEVKKHVNKETGIWVTYKGNVYDISNFVDIHPGGKKILLAAGGPIEPFWALYNMHNSDEVKELLEEYRIGSLTEADSQQSSTVAIDDPFANDPPRHPALKPASTKPYNAEPPGALLVDNMKTPNDIFYVRNHMPVPEVDYSKYRLTIIDMNNNSKSLTLEEIQRLPKVTVTAAIQCAGNRRGEMSKVKPVKGLSWGHAAIGNADWSGPRLTDVLKHYGFSSESASHVHFKGLDAGLDGVSYAASVPAEAALDPKRDVILAYEMNGAPLPRDHGGPVRVIVPGVVGARNVKWLGFIVLSERESDSHWQQGDYKGLSPSVDWDTADFSKAPAIQELPIQSAICTPEEGDMVDVIDGKVEVKGYAWSGGGRKIVRVDVTSDQGKTWYEAELHSGALGSNNNQWGWTLWSANLPVPPQTKKLQLWAKAVDSSYNTQPETFQHIWNFRGVLGNAYHRINIFPQ